MYLRSLVISSLLMVAIVLEEGMTSAYDTAMFGLYCADCILFGHILGWFLLRTHAGRHCFDLMFGWLREPRPTVDDPAASP